MVRRMSASIELLLLLILTSSSCITVVQAQYQCTYHANINITDADIAAPKFVVSSYDCCVACSDLPGCVASIYSNYYCHLKGTMNNQVVSTGPTLISQNGLTTSVPTPPPPPPSTPAPTTVAPATPTPPAPTPSPPTGTIVVIREVQCQYSDSCSRREDYSCYTNVYFNNTCRGSTNRLCTGYYINVDKYSQLGCQGVVLDTKQEEENICSMTTDETYVGHYCDVQATPAVNRSVVRTDCPYGCMDGSSCSSSSFTTGVCLASNPFSSMSGSSTMAWCFPQYVVYLTYGSIDCSGEVADGRSEPIGQQCFLDNNQFHIQNICG